MDNRAATGWGELQEPELTYPRFMDTDYVKLAHHLKRQQQATERYRRKQRIKGRLVTVAWSLLIVGFAAAAIVIH